MLRRLFNIAKVGVLGLCLLLTLAAAVLWVRKATRQDQFSCAREGGRLWVTGSRANGLYLSTIDGWPNAEPPRFYSVNDPELFIGPQISVSRGTYWERFRMNGVYGSSYIQLRSDGTAPWREFPLGVRGPERYDPDIFVGKTVVIPSAAADGTRLASGSSGGASPFWAQQGLLAARGTPVLTPPIFEIFVPHWMPAALFILPPLAWAALRLRRLAVRRLRMRQGQCLACGYDLRASTGRCPECGREAADAVVLPQPA